jgi:phosphoglycolate phosphatase-like HAD superfamily hydrolase
VRRLILFDIDGTLLITGGAAKRAFIRAVRDTYGTIGRLETFPFDGKTDPQIIRIVLKEAGVAEPGIEAKLRDCLSLYVKYNEEELPKATKAVLYPGVRDVLELLSKDERVTLGVLTGNVEQGAKQKLAMFDLARYFVFGAYGSDSADRVELARLGLQRAKEVTGQPFQPEETFIIGDTEFDIACAHAVGANAVAVATGNYGVERLRSYGPELVFRDYSDPRGFCELIMGFRQTADRTGVREKA